MKIFQDWLWPDPLETKLQLELELLLSQVKFFIISILEILELDLCKDDKFIVLASDGVWEFITNEEVA